MKDFSQMTMKQIGKSLLGILGTGLAVIICIFLLIYGILSLTDKNYCHKVFKTKAEMSYYSTKDDLIKCIDQYIFSVAPESAMNGLAFLECCDRYNVDVRFVITQAQVESHFATTGLAAKTRSAFNVLAYDGRTAGQMVKAGHCYDHPDKSIELYLKLLTTDYLVDGKTEMDMLTNFINREGKRYASSKNYEQMMRNVYDTLTTKTNINILYSEYQKYKMICGR